MVAISSATAALALLCVIMTIIGSISYAQGYQTPSSPLLLIFSKQTIPSDVTTEDASVNTTISANISSVNNTARANAANTAIAANDNSVNTGSSANDNSATTKTSANDNSVNTGTSANDDSVNTRTSANDDSVNTRTSANDDSVNTGTSANDDSVNTRTSADINSVNSTASENDNSFTFNNSAEDFANIDKTVIPPIESEDQSTFVNSPMSDVEVFHNSLMDEVLADRIMEQMRHDPRVHMTVPELMRSYGYGAEVHHVTTEDGYILEMHRMLGKKGHHSCAKFHKKKRRVNKGKCEPVLLQHGLLGSSSAWVLNYPEKALAYILTDLGYDVWMGNSRGNIYSMNHTHLDTRSWPFWDFSFQEMGQYDLPAVIDYILETTKREQLHYIGHSMGTTMYWVLSHHRPEFCKAKVASMSALGPVAFVGNAVSPIVLLAPFNAQLRWILIDILGEYRLLDPNFVLTQILERSCSLLRVTEVICANSVFLIIGFDSGDLNLDWLPVILGQLNAGASTKTIIHFAQLIMSEKFLMYDYGMNNYRHYKQFTPPSYNLSAVTGPVQLIAGPNDWLADPTDVQLLTESLTDVDLSFVSVSNQRFNHLDFLWGNDAKKLVYDHVIKFMQQHAF